LTASNSTFLAELCGTLGADYVLFDMEHGDSADLDQIPHLIRAADAGGAASIVRVPRNSPDVIQRVLDFGAAGICVPHVRTAEDAARAVSYARFAPVGERAMSPYVRAAGFEAAGWEEYWRTANDEIVVMVIVEDVEALENVEEIAKTPGLDVLWIGTGDLTQSMGLPFGQTHPEVEAAAERGLAVAREHGLISFRTVPSAVDVDAETRRTRLRQQFEDGYRMIAFGDAPLFISGLEMFRDDVRAAAVGIG
jgi:4-hydroxy-2-oxoheptanedioate aldolase